MSEQPVWIAVDTMSGDHGMEPVVKGAILAVKQHDAHVILVGDAASIRVYLEDYTGWESHIRIEHTSDFISMNEAPVRAVKKKRRASVVVATRLVKSGKASAVFSPGNTGATMAAAIKILGRLPGVKRPAIAVAIPRRDGKATVLIDAGANSDTKPEFLLQFAVMGEVYAREVLKISQPKVGILSNGSEEAKGSLATRLLYHKLKRLPFNFVGNVESHDLFSEGQKVDVVTCDGFLGNIVLKTIEGSAKSIFMFLAEELESSLLTRAGGLLVKPALQSIRDRLDDSSYGAAPLLGVNGVVMIGHGSSTEKAICNAIRSSTEVSRQDINRHIAENIHRFC